MEETKGNNVKYTVGIIFIILGVLFLIDSLAITGLNIGRIISFPLILFVIGLLILLNSDKKVLGAIITVIGGLLLIGHLVPGLYIGWGVILSLAIIGLGIHIILRNRNRYFGTAKTAETGEVNFERVKDASLNKDMLDDIAVFGGGTKIINSDNFSGGNITAIFGGSEIDLTNCRLAEGENVIDMLALFGGVEITVPRDWNVVITVTPVLGGFSNKIRRDPTIPIDRSRTLIIKGLALFGGGEIKS
jgi:predicted membrane protein